RVIELDPRAFKAYMNRGIGKNRLLDYAGAIADYTKVIEIAAPMSAVYSERGISYSNLGKKTEAIADLNKAIQLDPKNKQATDALAKINNTAATPTGSGSIYKTPTITREDVDKANAIMTPELKRQLENAGKHDDSGKCVSGNCFNGYGKANLSDGGVYEGNFVNGKSEGQGTLAFKSGVVYTGQFANGFRNGKGKTIYAGGSTHDGYWVNDQKSGQGTQTFASGDVYTRQFANNNYNGKGTYKYSNGQVYEGDWVNDKREGKGTLKFANGGIYTGQFAANTLNGKGKFTFENKDTYDGDWVAGKRTGKGTYTKPDGSNYVGEWKDDNYNGYGKQYTKVDGKVLEGTWKDGVLVNPTASGNSTSNNVPPRRTPTAAEINEQARQITPEMRKKTEELQRSTKALGVAAEKLYKTDAEWEKIAADFKLKIEDAVEKKKDDDLVIKIYGDFDQAASGGRDRPQVQYIRRQILRVMYQKGGLKLSSFVFKEMDKLNYTKEDRYVVLNSAIFV
ncbi:MAG: tetratricopeptide repeat protein, partial [Acidobacteriota bacterium]